MDKIYLYTFIDNDQIDSFYNLITNKNCDKLIEDIEYYYYDFEDFENIEDLVQYLKENDASTQIINYISKQTEIIDLTIGGISLFTIDILEYYNLLVEFESKIFKY